MTARGELAAAGQLPGRSRTRDRIADLADQHRPGLAGQSGRARLRLSFGGRLVAAHRRTPSPPCSDWSGTAATSITGTTRGRCSRSAALCFQRGQRQPRRPPADPRRGLARTGGRADFPAPALRRAARTCHMLSELTTGNAALATLDAELTDAPASLRGERLRVLSRVTRQSGRPRGRARARAQRRFKAMVRTTLERNCDGTPGGY